MRFCLNIILFCPVRKIAPGPESHCPDLVASESKKIKYYRLSQYKIVRRESFTRNPGLDARILR